MFGTKLDRRDIALLALLTALPALGYQFGIGNQIEQFSIVERLRDPTFLQGDFYVDSAAGFGPRYYHALVLSFLSRFAPLPAVVFVLTAVTNFALAAITLVAARDRLGASALGAGVAAAFAVVNSSFALGLAAFVRFESFQPASIAIPLSLMGFVLLLERRRFAAAASFAAASLFHPLIGVEIGAIAYAACALAEVGLRRSPAPLVAYIPSGLLFVAIVSAAWVLPSLPPAQDRLSAEEFFAILPTFRSPHHYLAAVFPLENFIRAGAFILGVVILYFQLPEKDEGADFSRRAMIAAAAIVVALCAASIILVDLLHNRAATTAQVWRNLLLLKWIGFLFFGAAVSRWVAEGRPLAMVAAFSTLIATGEAQPFMMLAAIAAVLVAGVAPLTPLRRAAFSVLLVALSVVLTLKIGVREEAARALLAAASIGALYASPLAGALAAGAVGAVIAALLAFGVLNRRLDLVDLAIFKPTYSLRDLKGDDAEIARWIRAGTPEGAAWITPPAFENFRLIARRPIVADFTSIPLGDAAMREWRRRMTLLYGEVEGGGFRAARAMDRNYHAISPDALARLSVGFNAPYAVLYRETPSTGEVLHENETYKAVRISSGSGQ